MVIYGKRRGSSRPPEIEITANSVFMAKNITPYEEDIGGRTVSGFEYDYYEWSKDEYFLKVIKENEELKQELIDTQLALVELYEGGEEL